MTAPTFDDSLVESLFPAPSFAAEFASPAAPVPKPYPGITPESTVALRRLLIENHKRFHVYFDPAGRVYHNHLSHHLFAAYTFGAPPRILQNVFDDHASYQRPAYQSPETITHENWVRHLGNGDFYNAYMNFFAAEIKKHGVSATFEKFVFSHEANWGPGEPRMLDRFFGGLVHPMIHFGHAAEFGIDGMAVEGLAQTAVHGKSFENLFDASFFAGSNTTSSYLSPSTLAVSPSDSSAKQPSKDRVHSFSILARILADDRLKAGAVCNMENILRHREVQKNVGGILREYASLWNVDDDDKDIQERVEELNWFVTLMFGIGGWKKDKPFTANFLLAHYVTSNLFLSSILSLLKPKHQVDLMRSYFATSLVWFVAQGSPALDVKGFFRSVTVDPKPDPDPKLLDAKEAEGNPWHTILMHTVRHPDEHQVKSARALAHGAALYGARPKGYFAHTELKGAEEIDGTLFVRTGGLLMDALHWNYEVKERVGGVDQGNGWSRKGLE
ncbi:unnamed protein product [Rhizoctonia solani]|uniref:Oxidoreductase AflY n=1 Tax=Rhizoctonia solani TaxID=456999 RepID=A0A8H3CSU1_9AGAM|nr:unnamed protein product [Rhizoctonia solani]